jgi:diguanylate cyclase (GGDEF)-like protein
VTAVRTDALSVPLPESARAPGLDRLLQAERGLDLVVSCLEEQAGAEAVLAVAEDGNGRSVRARSGEGLDYLLHNEDVLLRRVGTGTASVHALPRLDGRRQATHVVTAPIGLGDRNLGILCAGFEAPPVEGTLLWMVETYARLATLCLADADAFRRLIGAAAVDGLTGCLTYAALRQALDSEVQRARRHDRRLACCFLDLDDFKHVNDDQGHAMGNRVLSAVGAALRDGARRSDTIGRYGGDEFVAVLPETNREAAVALCGRLKQEIRRETGRVLGEQIDASVGIAPWRAGWATDQLLAEADRALAHAKSHAGGIAVSDDGRLGEAR